MLCDDCQKIWVGNSDSPQFFPLVSDSNDHVRRRINVSDIMVLFAFGFLPMPIYVTEYSKRPFASRACCLHLAVPHLVKWLLVNREGLIPGLAWRLWFIFLLVLNNSRFWCVVFSYVRSELIFWLGCCAAERASRHLMTLFHVHSQHGWRHTFLVTLSALDEMLNAVQMLLLPVGPNAILGPPNSGLVRAVWVSTGKPERIEDIINIILLVPYSCQCIQMARIFIALKRSKLYFGQIQQDSLCLLKINCLQIAEWPYRGCDTTFSY